MPTRVQNYGPGANVVYGRPGWNEALNLGDGADIAITGGGGHKSVNSGNDRHLPGEPSDQLYSESHAGFDNPWIGGHRLVNGVYDEFHEYHLGARDSSRISLSNWGYTEANPGEYRMFPGKVPGLFAIHGPGGDGEDATWLKSFDTRPGAQQLSMAGDDIDVFRFIGTTTQVANGFDLNLDTVWLVGNTDKPANDGQTVQMDDKYLSSAADFATIHTSTNSASAQEAAVQAWIDRSSDGDGHDWLLLNG